jgi:hypothetical protein
MKTRQILLTLIIALTFGFLVGTITGLIIGVKISKKSPDTEMETISATVVLDKIQDQAFLVTRTIITDQEIQIEIDQGSAWSNFWWGHEITAEGVVQIDVGLDLSRLSEEDIEVDNETKTIIIDLPSAEVYDSSLKGDIDVSTKSGILKKLLATDNNEDYNLAMAELTSQAEEAVAQDEELLEEAQSSALSTLQVILKDTGYTLTEV